MGFEPRVLQFWDHCLLTTMLNSLSVFIISWCTWFFLLFFIYDDWKTIIIFTKSNHLLRWFWDNASLYFLDLLSFTVYFVILWLTCSYRVLLWEINHIMRTSNKPVLWYFITHLSTYLWDVLRKSPQLISNLSLFPQQLQARRGQTEELWVYR